MKYRSNVIYALRAWILVFRNKPWRIREYNLMLINPFRKNIHRFQWNVELYRFLGEGGGLEPGKKREGNRNLLRSNYIFQQNRNQSWYG